MKYLTCVEKDGKKLINIKYEKISIGVFKDDIDNNKKIALSDVVFDKKDTIIDKIEVDGKTIYLYLNKKGILHITGNINAFYNIRYKLWCKITRKNIYFFGIVTNRNKAKETFDNIYFNDEKVGNIKRFTNMKHLKHIGIIKLPMDIIEKSNEFHNTISIGKNPNESVSLRMKRSKKPGMHYHSMKQINDKIVIVRSTVNSAKLRITRVDMQPEYTKLNRLKNNVARFIAKIIGKKDIVLLFEKETKRAEESGFYIFEKIINRKLKSTKAYFIIDKTSKDYDKIKEKYGSLIVEKYSFRHYLYIYISKYFISSELSNHVINTRLYIKSLNDEVCKKPLVFLQHGIMFAKPVDNPAAQGFYKGKSQLNIYKNVISSDLEATQFYRMGYTDEDLIKCGLTKFDSSSLDKDADKILFMQTYRYWEEGMINNDDAITQTTYYKSYMDVIRAFKKANMLDKFRVSCHPKFAECLVKAAPEYEKIIEPDLTKALRESRVFITDYSSASYDAHYRGAYIIYYWADKEYLIEQYKAIPPINETNCDGVPVYSPEQLVEEVKKAIKNNYIMEQKYEDNYRKINEFHDGKNGDRLIEELIKLKILK